MDLDGSDAKAQLERNAFCRNPIGNEQEDLPFAGRQGCHSASGFQRVGTVIRQMTLDHRPTLPLLCKSNLVGANDIENVAGFAYRKRVSAK